MRALFEACGGTPETKQDTESSGSTCKIFPRVLTVLLRTADILLLTTTGGLVHTVCIVTFTYSCLNYFLTREGEDSLLKILRTNVWELGAMLGRTYQQRQVALKRSATSQVNQIVDLRPGGILPAHRLLRI